MIDDLRAMAIFAETIKQGSFAAAAKHLNLSASVVSYQIGQLEKSLGVTLLYRSTRNLSLTHEGQVLLKHAVDMQQSAITGINQLTSSKGELNGALSLTLPHALTRSSICHNIAQFSQQHPRLSLELSFTDQRQNLISEGIDLAIRVGKMDDSRLMAKRLSAINRLLVCSANYLESVKTPTRLEELAQLNWISLSALPDKRPFIDNQGRRHEAKFAGTLCVNSVDAVAQLCIGGAGVATPPDFLVANEIKSGNLVQLLPDWRIEPVPVYAVWPSSQTVNKATRSLLDHLMANVSDTLR